MCTHTHKQKEVGTPLQSMFARLHVENGEQARPVLLASSVKSLICECHCFYNYSLSVRMTDPIPNSRVNSGRPPGKLYCPPKVGLGLVMQLFGQDGPFVPSQEGEPSAFQAYMQRVGLPVVTVKTSDFHILSGQQSRSIREIVCTSRFEVLLIIRNFASSLHLLLVDQL